MWPGSFLTNCLKSDSHLSKKIVICFIESAFKMMKNAFCFILKTFLVLKIFNTFWSYRKNSLTRKIKLTANLMTSQPGQQTIAIHILTNISRSKGNQTVKLGQLIEYNKRNIFLQKLCKKWGREISPRPLFVFKKSFQYVSIALNLAYNKNKTVQDLRL